MGNTTPSKYGGKTSCKSCKARQHSSAQRGLNFGQASHSDSLSARPGENRLKEEWSKKALSQRPSFQRRTTVSQLLPAESSSSLPVLSAMRVGPPRGCHNTLHKNTINVCPVILSKELRNFVYILRSANAKNTNLNWITFPSLTFECREILFKHILQNLLDNRREHLCSVAF